MVEDLNVACVRLGKKDEDESLNYLLVWLLGILTGGIYTMYWWYRQGSRIHKTGKDAGISVEEKGITYLLLYLLSAVLGSAAFGAIGFLWISSWVSVISSAIYGGVSSLIGGFANDLLGYGLFENSFSLWSFVWLFILSVFLLNLVHMLQWACSDWLFIRNVNRLCASSLRPSPLRTELPVSEKKDPPQDGRTVAFPTGKLEGISGEYAGVVLDLKDNDPMILGRDGSCNLILKDPEISRRHCQIQYSQLEKVYLVIDFSANGVYLGNGKKLVKGSEEKLQPGNTIRLGQSPQVFRLK
jgi:hypothetical protein